MHVFELEWLDGQPLLDVVQHFFTDHESDPLFEPLKDHHLGVKNPLIPIGQVPVEHVQFILLLTHVYAVFFPFGSEIGRGPTDDGKDQRWFALSARTNRRKYVWDKIAPDGQAKSG